MPICTIYNSQGENLKTFDTSTIGWKVSIGRSSSCDVSLRGLAESNVSREHIILRKTGSSWQLESEGLSGVFMNAAKIETAPVNEGDVFRFSQLFLCIGDKTVPCKFKLIWDLPTEDNKRSAVIWPGINTIGASRDNYITVRRNDISRVHGRLISEGENLYYENLFSTLYADLNGQPIGGKKIELQEGDVLTLGETPIRVVKNSLKKKEAVLENQESSEEISTHRKKGVSRKAIIIMSSFAAAVVLFLIFMGVILTKLLFN